MYADAGTAFIRSLPSPQAAVSRTARYQTDLFIDGWLVQPMLNCLTRGGASVRVRAQLMDLLLCLASRPGKVFGKSEIVADVWEGRRIADSGLSRCVAELRAAIGDDAQQPRVIETIIKRGYRLIAQVEIPDGPAPAAPAAARFPAVLTDEGVATRSLVRARRGHGSHPDYVQPS
jgi:DNA-binding winged helix-turn-helix (wHTH) protein